MDQNEVVVTLGSRASSLIYVIRLSTGSSCGILIQRFSVSECVHSVRVLYSKQVLVFCTRNKVPGIRYPGTSTLYYPGSVCVCVPNKNFKSRKSDRCSDISENTGHLSPSQKKPEVRVARVLRWHVLVCTCSLQFCRGCSCARQFCRVLGLRCTNDSAQTI